MLKIITISHWNKDIEKIIIYYKLNIDDMYKVKCMCHLLIYMEVSIMLGMIGGILVVVGSSMGAIDKITKGK